MWKTIKKLAIVMAVGLALALGGRAVARQGSSTRVVAPKIPTAPRALPSAVTAVRATGGDRIADWHFGPNGCAPHEFGSALAADGDALFVAAPRRDYATEPSGSLPVACLYRRQGNAWALVQKVHADDPAGAEGFARAVTLGSTYAVVGAPGHENNDGPAHDFARSGSGTLLLRALLAPRKRWDASLEYGDAVASDARYVFVGAHLNLEAGCDGCGEVDIFDRSVGNKAVAVLHGKVPDENFGTAVAISQTLLVVGAAGYYSSGKSPGAAYVYRRNGASFDPICRLPGDTPAEEYGQSVAVDGERVVVSGRARVTVHEIVGSRCVPTNTFSPGGPVAARGDYIAVGDAQWNGGQPGSGRVALLRVRPDGTIEHRAFILPPMVIAHGAFGASVALTETEVIAGAPGRSNDGTAFVAGAKLQPGGGGSGAQ